MNQICRILTEPYRGKITDFQKKLEALVLIGCVRATGGRASRRSILIGSTDDDAKHKII